MTAGLILPAFQMAKLILNWSLSHFGNNITVFLSPHLRHSLNTLELVHLPSTLDAPATVEAYHGLAVSRTNGLLLPFQLLSPPYLLFHVAQGGTEPG